MRNRNDLIGRDVVFTHGSLAGERVRVADYVDASPAKPLTLKHVLFVPLIQALSCATLGALFVAGLALLSAFPLRDVIVVALFVLCAASVAVFPFVSDLAARRFAAALSQQPSSRGLLTFEQALQLRDKLELDSVVRRSEERAGESKVRVEKYVLFSRYHVPWNAAHLQTLFNQVVVREQPATERSCVRGRRHFSQADFEDIRDAAIVQGLAYWNTATRQHGWSFSHNGRETLLICAYAAGVSSARAYMSKRLKVKLEHSPTAQAAHDRALERQHAQARSHAARSRWGSGLSELELVEESAQP